MQRTGFAADTLLRRAQLCLREQRYADAVYYLRRYLASPDSVWADERCAAMLALAQCHVRMHSRTEAERWLLRACAEAPDSAQAWREAAAFYASFRPQASALCRARAAALD